MSPGWSRPETLRFGASALLDDLLRVLAVPPDRDDDDDDGFDGDGNGGK
jgi:hypothetical protein